MKSKRDAPPSRPETPPALMGAHRGAGGVPGSGPGGFPYPMVVTNLDREVVFLNCAAAQNLFGEALRAGDPCPLCSTTPIMSGIGRMHLSCLSCPQRGRT